MRFCVRVCHGILLLCVLCSMASAELSKDQKAQITKTSTERLRQNLLSSGAPEEEVEAMDRPALIEAVAQQKGTVVQLRRDGSSEVELKRLELEMEMKKLEMEERKQRMALEAEERQREREAEERRREKEADLEAEKARFAHQYRMRQLELAGSGSEMIMRCGQDEENEEGVSGAVGTTRWENSLAAKTKRYGDILRHVLPRMPADISDIPQYFENVEHLYDMYEVPDELRAKLIIPHLSDRAKSLISRLSLAELEDYDKLKKFLLGEFKLSATEYKARFDKATKRNDETHVLFTARLKNALKYYVESREVITFGGLCDLLVADKLKSCLSLSALNYVLSLEGSQTYDASEIARLADLFCNTHVEPAGYYNRQPNSHRNKQGPGSPKGRGYPRFAPQRNFGRTGELVSNSTSRGGYRGLQRFPANNGNSGGPPRCWRCGEVGHLSKSCPQARESKPPARYANSNNARVQCAVVDEYNVSLGAGQTSTTVPVVNSQCNKVELNAVDGSSEILSLEWEFGEYPAVVCCADQGTHQTKITHPTTDLKISQLKFVDVLVDGQKYTALSDSGCQIPILNVGVITISEHRVLGSVNLRGVVGEAVNVPLVSVMVKLAGDAQFDRVMEPLQLTCAVAELNADGYDVILPQDIIVELQELPSVGVMKVPVNCVIHEAGIDNGDNDAEKVACDDVSDVRDDTNDMCCIDDVKSTNDVSKTQLLINEQMNDSSLTGCWKQAEAGKGGFVIYQGVLYHNDKMYDQAVCQLCVPINRRNEVMKLAHDSVFSCHLAEKKTRERIRLSFYWPNMKRDVLSYVQSCQSCQLRARPLTTDRVPITPITRAELPFQVLYMDCIGKLEPMSAQGHKYCLCVIDSCTRWPTVYALKSLSAKAVCDSLLELFTHIGVPNQIVSDCGTNFTSQLTQSMLKYLGCTPVFNTPNHPEASGMIERFNQTFKNMLFHVVKQHGRQWHRFVPFLTWALREVSNSTTNVSPYALVYGRVPRGPLAVLKESWTGENDVSMNLTKPVAEYLDDLRQKLSSVTKIAADHARSAQTDYAGRYNRRARDKHFAEGDLVVVLAPPNAGKMCPRWCGPATVVKVKSPYSYLVDMGDGQVRHLHANKMRRFVARAHGCGVISAHDTDFGRVRYPNTDESDRERTDHSDPIRSSSLTDKQCSMSDYNVKTVCDKLHCEASVLMDKLSHLSLSQQNDVLTVLDEFAVCFSEQPGLYTGIEHCIDTTPEFKPKRMRAYRVPDIFKPQVEQQIRELLDMGLIKPSNSPMASPIVCVAKKNGGVRLAVDYRYLNSFTIADAYPMTTVNEILRKMGSANLISLYDAKSGYWQCPIAEKDQWKTAFITHDGLYEWTRMAFGLRNSGATYVRMTKDILRPLNSFADSYVDDMAVGSGYWSEHMRHVRRFLSTIRDAGLTLSFEKCEFAKPEVKLVGHIVGSGSRRADPQRTECLERIPRPTTKRELRKYLGAMSFYREYIAQFAEIVKPLTDLTSKKMPNVLVWGEAQERAFCTLKERLSDAQVLRIPLLGVPFVLHTDASQTCVGASLGQIDASGVENPLAFISQKLTPTQISWAVIEKEAYAIVWALEKFRDLVLGYPITVYSDHNPLQYIKDSATKSAKLLRWSLALAEFDLEVKYTAGRTNTFADMLSRL